MRPASTTRTSSPALMRAAAVTDPAGPDPTTNTSVEILPGTPLIMFGCSAKLCNLAFSESRVVGKDSEDVEELHEILENRQGGTVEPYDDCAAFVQRFEMKRHGEQRTKIKSNNHHDHRQLEEYRKSLELSAYKLDFKIASTRIIARDHCHIGLHNC